VKEVLQVGFGVHVGLDEERTTLLGKLVIDTVTGAADPLNLLRVTFIVNGVPLIACCGPGLVIEYVNGGGVITTGSPHPLEAGLLLLSPE
jgi:hypothetical protein